mmetsp:Transcript_117/g.187  ORF Transcript_117/g.187 Transcript_117/m.187 type:complete len:524 (-) Transcript_117:849-2420(-)
MWFPPCTSQIALLLCISLFTSVTPALGESCTKEIELVQSRVIHGTMNTGSRGWWADGKDWASFDGDGFVVTCNSRATGVYQYVPASPEVSDGWATLAVSFTLLASPSHPRASSSNVPFAGVGLMLKPFNQSARGSQSYWVQATSIESSLWKRVLIKEPHAFMLVVGCTGWTGSLTVNYASLIFSRVPRLYSHKMQCPAQLLAPKLAPQEESWVGFSWGEAHDIEPVSVTFVSHASLDRLDSLITALLHWFKEEVGGKTASIALWIRNDSVRLSDVQSLVEKKLERVRGARARMHCILTWRKHDGEAYPINRLRNAALKAAPTDFVLLADGDQVPYGPVVDEFRQFMTRRENRVPVAWILAAFEGQVDDKFICNRGPRRKEDAVRWVARKRLFVFKNAYQPKAYAPIDFEKWSTARTPYTVDYQEQFEPYVIVSKAMLKLSGVGEQPFDERFAGYGWNKAAFITELYFAGYTFFVSPSSFLVHCSHKKSTSSVAFSTSLQARAANRLARFEWAHELESKYLKLS